MKMETIQQNLWDILKAAPMGKVLDLSTYIKNQRENK